MSELEDIEGEGEDEEDVKGPKYPISVPIAQGHVHFRLKNYPKAIECFNAVLERDPKNVKSLVDRSKCYLYQQDFDNAMKDVEKALKLDPKNVAGICQKGEIQYVMGDFEFAYVTFQNGFVKKPNYEPFQIGRKKCMDAIMKAIGPESGLIITKEDVRMVEEHLKKKQHEYFSGRKDLHVQDEKVPEDPAKQIYKSRVYLREACEDKWFMEGKLDKKPVPRDQVIEEECKRGVDFLNHRQDFWQMRRPLYSRKRLGCSLKVPISHFEDKERLEEKRKEAFATCVNEAIAMSEAGQHEKAYELSSRALDYVSPTDYTEITEALEIMGSEIYELGDYDSAIEIHEQQRDIALKNLPSEDVYRALWYLGEDYMAKEDFTEALSVYKQVVDVATTDEERGYALQKLCECQLRVNMLDEALESAQKALAISRDTSDKELELMMTELSGAIEDARNELAVKEASDDDLAAGPHNNKKRLGFFSKLFAKLNNLMHHKGHMKRKSSAVQPDVVN